LSDKNEVVKEDLNPRDLFLTFLMIIGLGVGFDLSSDFVYDGPDSAWWMTVIGFVTILLALSSLFWFNAQIWFFVDRLIETTEWNQRRPDWRILLNVSAALWITSIAYYMFWMEVEPNIQGTWTHSLIKAISPLFFLLIPSLAIYPVRAVKAFLSR